MTSGSWLKRRDIIISLQAVFPSNLIQAILYTTYNQMILTDSLQQMRPTKPNQPQKITSPFDIHAANPPTVLRSSFPLQPTSTPYLPHPPQPRPQSTHNNHKKPAQLEPTQSEQPQTGIVINSRAQPAKRCPIFNPKKPSNQSSFLDRNHQQMQDHNQLNWSFQNEQSNTISMSPLRSSLGRNTLSHNTVEQLIHKFEESLSPLRLQTGLHPQQNSQYGCVNQKEERYGQESYRRQLEDKQKQIRFLRMELERYRRCQNISKEKQAIYERLVGKLKKDFEELRAKTQHSQTIKDGKGQWIAQPFCPQTKRNQHREDSSRNMFRNVKTPFNLLKDTAASQHRQIQHSWAEHSQVQHSQHSQHIQHIEHQQHQPQQTPKLRQQGHYYLAALKKQHPQQLSSKAMTFNAHRQTIKLGHKKRLKPQNLKSQVYENKYELPASTSARILIADKLSQMNMKMWEKKGEKSKQRAGSFVEGRSRVGSAHSLLLGLY